jgi:hypothetical protein
MPVGDTQGCRSAERSSDRQLKRVFQRRVRPRTGIVEKQQQRVVTATLRCPSIWTGKERIDFRFVEIGHHRSCSLLVGDAAQLGAPIGYVPG